MFTKLNNEYLDSRPAGEGVEDKAALLANFPIGEPEAEPVEKILGGAEDVRKEVLGFEFEKRSPFTGEMQSRYCSAIRLSGTDWQVYSFIPLAMQALQNGDDTSKCRCIFIPAATGVTNPEAAGAAMRCNEGCTNPAEFTQ